MSSVESACDVMCSSLMACGDVIRCEGSFMASTSSGRERLAICWSSAGGESHVMRGYDVMMGLDIFRDVKFGIQIGSDWARIGQIWDFLRSVSLHFGAGCQNLLKLILKRPRFVAF